MDLRLLTIILLIAVVGILGYTMVYQKYIDVKPTAQYIYTEPIGPTTQEPYYLQSELNRDYEVIS